MIFKPPLPLTSKAALLRSLLIVGMLIGSILPPIGSLNIVLITTLIAAPVLAYEILRWLPKLHPIIWFIVPVFGVLAISGLLSPPATEYGQDKFSKLITLTLVSALAAALLRDRGTIRIFARVWVGAAVILALLALSGYDGGRADVFGSNPIWLARAIATGAVFAVWMWWQRVASPLLMICTLVILGGGIIASGSRGPLVSVVVGVLVLALFAGRGRWWRVVLIGVGGAVALWIVQVAPMFSGSRFATILQQGSDDQVRTLYWDLTMPIIAEYPGGVGLGNWWVYAGYPRHMWPHNIFIETFAELGVVVGVGLVALVAAILIALASQARKQPTTLLVLALLAAEIVGVSVSGDLNARTFWFMLTLGFLYATTNVIDGPHPLKGESRLVTSTSHVKRTQPSLFARSV